MALARARKAPLRTVHRAYSILAAAGGQYNAQIARDLDLHVDTVRTSCVPQLMGTQRPSEGGFRAQRGGFGCRNGRNAAG